LIFVVIVAAPGYRKAGREKGYQGTIKGFELHRSYGFSGTAT
jgi:hypothetical protein